MADGTGAVARLADGAVRHRAHSLAGLLGVSCLTLPPAGLALLLLLPLLEFGCGGGCGISVSKVMVMGVVGGVGGGGWKMG